MQILSTKLKEHLSFDLTTLALLVKMTRTDGMVIGLTSHDQAIEQGNVTYHADGALTAFNDIAHTIDLRGHDTKVSGVLESHLISEADIKAGHYDHARIDVYVCNWQSPDDGVLQLRRGWLGEITLQGGTYQALYIPFHDLLNKKVGEIYTPECRFDLGDAQCQVDCLAYKKAGVVSVIVDKRHFIDNTRTEETAYFKDGVLRWLSGQNKGISAEIAQWDLEQKQFSLWLDTPFAIEVGDTYEVIAGCDKRFATCKARFNNAARYGGFPHLPGIGKILDYPN